MEKEEIKKSFIDEKERAQVNQVVRDEQVKEHYTLEDDCQAKELFPLFV